MYKLRIKNLSRQKLSALIMECAHLLEVYGAEEKFGLDIDLEELPEMYEMPKVDFPDIKQSEFEKSKKIYCPATSCRMRDTCSFKAFGTITDKIDSDTVTNELKIPPCTFTGSEK